MAAISYAKVRANLAGTMDQVCEDHAPLTVTRGRASSVVMMSLEDYESLQETAWLPRSRVSAHRLLESVAELEADTETHQR